MKTKIQDVIENGFCIGCGNCEAACKDSFKTNENELGLIQSTQIREDAPSIADKICPFSNEDKDEDYFNLPYKAESNAYSPELGYYRNVFAGFDNDLDARISSSSGGLVSHLISELFDRGSISGAIVATNSETAPARLEYAIIRSIAEINNARKSKYHMVSHGEVIADLLKSEANESIVYVGIPCSVKAVKLMCEEFPELKRKIKFTVAIFCGHQKSHAFSEFVSWQMGIPPADLKLIDYRHKEKSTDASKYYYRAFSSDTESKARVDQLRWMDWGLGLFKPKACEFCDDVSGETADIIFGDAWHKRYAKDYKGTNLIITRSKYLETILLDSKSKGKITLFDESPEFVFKSQGGNFRHRNEGLLARLRLFNKNKLWTPIKNPNRLSRYKENPKREKIYLARHEISMRSHTAFSTAKKERDLSTFFNILTPLINSYEKISTTPKSRLIKRLKKIIGR